VQLRITNYTSLVAFTQAFPLTAKMTEILRKASRASVLQSNLPAQSAVYYFPAPGEHMQSSRGQVLRRLLEAIGWLPGLGANLDIASKSGIAHARTSLG
jgi:hypothetical protein